eukprot:3511907-Alexandrium_andersonii.AAC.1
MSCTTSRHGQNLSPCSSKATAKARASSWTTPSVASSAAAAPGPPGRRSGPASASPTPAGSSRRSHAGSGI